MFLKKFYRLWHRFGELFGSQVASKIHQKSMQNSIIFLKRSLKHFGNDLGSKNRWNIDARIIQNSSKNNNSRMPKLWKWARRLDENQISEVTLGLKSILNRWKKYYFFLKKNIYIYIYIYIYISKVVIFSNKFLDWFLMDVWWIWESCCEPTTL